MGLTWDPPVYHPKKTSILYFPNLEQAKTKTHGEIVEVTNGTHVPWQSTLKPTGKPVGKPHTQKWSLFH